MKRHPKLRDLSDDHHTALVVAARCRRASDDDVERVWASLRAAFASHFEPHFAIEERFLLPALEALGGVDRTLADRIRDEHARLRAAAAVSDPSRAEVREFGRLLERHVRFEEREVFESSQDRLPAAALDAIATACREVPRSCPTEIASPLAAAGRRAG